MLYERMYTDVCNAANALAAKDFSKVNDMLCHAQDIIVELESALDVTAWDGGPGLASLYVFLREELVAANMNKDAKRMQTCKELLKPLAEAWRTAVESTER